jgi:DME family drug/metabolite transporter
VDHAAGARRRVRAIAAVVVASMLFGTTGTALQKGPDGVTSLGAGAARLLLGGLTLMVAAASVPSRRGRRDWRLHARSGLFGGAMVALYQLAFFQATTRAGVAVATVCTIASGPVFAAIIERVRSARSSDRPALGRPWWIGTIGCIVGVVLIVTPRVAGTDDVAMADVAGDLEALGVVAAFVAGLGYAAYATAAKHQMERGLDPAASMATLFGVGALITSPLLLVEPMRWVTTARGALMIVHLGVLTVGLAYTLYGRGLRRLSTPTVVTLTLVEPLTAALLSVVVLRESLPAVSWAGIGVVLGGLVIATRTAGTVAATPAVRPEHAA